MKKKYLLRGLLTLGITVFILFSVLVIHIYMVTKSKNDDKRIRQLARIDFKQELDSTQALQIKNKVLSMDGVDAAYFNLKDKTFVYSFNPQEQNADNVFITLMKSNAYKAIRFRVDDEQLANGCPVIDKSSLTYQFSNLVQNVFN